MKPTKIVLIVLAVLLISGISFFGYKNYRKTVPQNNEEAAFIAKEEKVDSDEESSFSGTLKDLFTLETDKKCSYSMINDETENSGVMYISGKNIRGDSTIKLSTGEVTESHIILKDSTTYTWGTAMPYGIKMSSDETLQDTTGETDEAAPVDDNLQALEERIDYKCLPWIVDSSKFELPSDVEFKDISVLLPSGDGNAAPDMCAACDFIQTEQEKADCLATFKCE